MLSARARGVVILAACLAPLPACSGARADRRAARPDRDRLGATARRPRRSTPDPPPRCCATSRPSAPARVTPARGSRAAPSRAGAPTIGASSARDRGVLRGRGTRARDRSRGRARRLAGRLRLRSPRRRRRLVLGPRRAQAPRNRGVSRRYPPRRGRRRRRVRGPRGHDGTLLDDGRGAWQMPGWPPRGCATSSRIATASDHTCALRKSGAVSCWGENCAGQLGDGTRAARARLPSRWWTSRARSASRCRRRGAARCSRARRWRAGAPRGGAATRRIARSLRPRGGQAGVWLPRGDAPAHRARRDPRRGAARGAPRLRRARERRRGVLGRAHRSACISRGRRADRGDHRRPSR